MSEKTEQPTPQKLRKAREDGQVPHSKDFTQTVLVAALFGYLLASAEDIVHDFAEMMLMPAGVLTMEFNLAVNAVATQLLRRALEILAPFLGIVILLGLLAEAGQTGMLISFKAMKPSGKKLNVVANVKNIFGAKNLFDFLKSNIKIALLSCVVYVLLRDALPALMTLPMGGLSAVGVATGVILKTMMIWVCLGYAALSIADLFWQRQQHVKQLRMTKDEVIREYKEAEGDPHIKHKRKELHQEMLEHTELQQTRQASVVVTNPTHLAVALRYVKDETPLPVVLAKGEGLHARRIADVARAHGIPVMQNIPVARALMAQAAVDQYIPSELIEPVAHLLRLVREMNPPEES